MNREQVMKDLEKLVDGSGLQFIVTSLSQIAYAKSEHLRENWQDYNLADKWEKDAIKLSEIEVNN